jgi:hypothetical protein
MRIRRRRKNNTPKVKLAEVDLAAFVVKHLQNEGWEIYQEVQIKSFGAIADIVAIKGDDVMVVEAKTSFSLAVLGQANHWQTVAHYAAIAVPRAQNNSKARNFGRKIAWKFGIGVFAVSPVRGQVTTMVAPKRNVGADTKKILSVLTEQHKTFAKAGSKEGKHLTLFKMTAQRLTEYVKEHPGVHLRDAVKNIKHHYKNDYNASRSLGVQMRQHNKIDTLYVEWDGDKQDARLYYRATPPSPFPPARKSIEESAQSKT